MASISADVLARLLDDHSSMERDNILNAVDTTLTSNKALDGLYKNVKDIHDYLCGSSAASVQRNLRDADATRRLQGGSPSRNALPGSDTPTRGSLTRTTRNIDYGHTFSQGLQKSLQRAFKNSKFNKELESTLGSVITRLGGSLDEGTGNLKGRLGSVLMDNATSLIKSMMEGKGKEGAFEVFKNFEGAAKDISKFGQNFSNLGKGLGNIQNALKGTNGLGRVVGRATGSFSQAFTGLGNAMQAGGPMISKGLGQMAGAFKAGGGLKAAWAAGGTAVKAGAATMGKALISVVAKIGPWGAAIAGAIYTLFKFKAAIAPAIEGIKAYTGALKAAANREANSAKENAKLAKERLAADVNTLVEIPFKRLADAANSVTSAFEDSLRVITATQGYTKSDVQDLMSSYAQRLRDEGLTDIVAGSSLMTNLSKVIESGLSGAVAEEFAYQATVLGNAIPTQDFFGYASTYSSIAANAIRLGKSQDEAIKEANDSLSEFANNLLYASRELAGGYSTGLTNAQSLYEQSVKIAQAARSTNVSEISGVMTSVAAIVGATAPDLANAITDAVYSAATGGNNSSIVALRSLAGINASNTEFLRALANNPQQVFSALFTNLAGMYNDSSDAYMEKAEGYAQLFGLSSDAFARIDFNYLAEAISQMNTNSKALEQNMDLMVAGETTLTSEQLKNREINKYMIENGLSYVLDNEAARAIQQHMWDEQMKRELMEATYGVNLEGAALEALTGILTTVKNLLTFLNPISALMKISDMVGTIMEGNAQQADIQKVLMLGNVGAQNEAVLRNLTTRNANLGLYTPLVESLGGTSEYSATRTDRLRSKAILSFLSTGNPQLLDLSGGYTLDNAISDLYGVSSRATSRAASSNISSRYAWGIMGKSASSSIANFLGAGTSYEFTKGSAARKASQNKTSGILQDLFKESESYEELAKKARNKGITNLDEALEEMGSSKSEAQSYFETKQTQAAAKEAEKYRETERQYYELGLQFFQTKFPEEFQAPLFASLKEQNENTATLLKNFTDYFINHLYYDSGLGGEKYYKQVLKVQKEEKSQKGDAVYALAEALTANTNDLRDPTLQTNALLSEILLVVNAIMQQNNGAGAATGLAETLAALAMGGTYKAK